MLAISNWFQPPQLSSTFRAYGSVCAVAGVTVISSYINGALTVALPSIASALPLETKQLQWPLSMLALTNGAFLLIGGGLADSFGRRSCFLIGTTFTGLVGLITAFTSDATLFILMCAFLGLGGALLTPAGVGIIGASLPDGKFKNNSFSALGAGQPVGFILGLVLGGLLAESWPNIFFILTGLAFAFSVLAWACLPFDGEIISPYGQPSLESTLHLTSNLNSAAPSANASTTTLPNNANLSSSSKMPLSSFDWLGSFLSTSGLILLTFALADAESAPQGWKTPYIPALLPVSTILLGGFWWWQTYLEKVTFRRDNGETVGNHLPRGPLLPPSLFKAPRFGTVLATVFCAWLSFNTLSYFSTLMYQEVQHLSPIKTSLSYLPMIGSGLILYSFAGILVARLSAVWIIVIGTGGGAVACALFGFVGEETIYVKGMLWVMILIVFTDLSFPACQLFACSVVGKDNSALAGSLFNTTTRLATSLGLAITSSISSSVTRSYASKNSISISSEKALTAGYHAVGWTCFGFSMASILIAIVFLRDIGVVGKLEERTITSTPVANLENGSARLSRASNLVLAESKRNSSRPPSPNRASRNRDENSNFDSSDSSDNIALKRFRSQIPQAAHLRSYSEEEVQRTVG